MIVADNLHKTFGCEHVLLNVSFTVSPGTIIAVVGPSGAGKTTLLNIVAGILQPDKGLVRIGKDSRFGYMLQEPALLPWRTLEENAHLGLELIDAPKIKKNSGGFFNEFDLNGSQQKYPHECSLGMQQRVALIRTLAIEPSILLLDEPFSAFDYDIKLRAQMNLVRYVEEKKPAVLLVTHDIEDAIALADKVIVLSAKPAVVKAEIQIDLDLAKRDPIAARTAPEFQRYFEEIWQHLKYLSPL